MTRTESTSSSKIREQFSRRLTSAEFVIPRAILATVVRIQHYLCNQIKSRPYSDLRLMIDWNYDVEEDEPMYFITCKESGSYGDEPYYIYRDEALFFKV
ncbi:hypothetical protein PsorP6_001704 [Peronosclerospora sorghi]|uniref:Uncharacterized protein n=1 Tax=Peronosclerospora sorghi TaxID=230839 RepID=A0ACC0WU75_9STRA|nr:hypothetical protein PsorP6_001704 [Peronosclerospora sorghi]